MRDQGSSEQIYRSKDLTGWVRLGSHQVRMTLESSRNPYSTSASSSPLNVIELIYIRRHGMAASLVLDLHSVTGGIHVKNHVAAPLREHFEDQGSLYEITTGTSGVLLLRCV